MKYKVGDKVRVICGCLGGRDPTGVITTAVGSTYVIGVHGRHFDGCFELVQAYVPTPFEAKVRAYIDQELKL